LRLMPNAAAHRGKTLPGTSRAESPRNLSLRKQGAGTHVRQAASHEDTSPDRRMAMPRGLSASVT